MEELQEEKKLTKLEILKAFAEYPLQTIAIFDGDIEYPIQDIVEGIDFVSEAVIAERARFEPEQIKLVLKNVKKLSDEEALTIANAFMNNHPMVRALDGRLLAQSFFDEETSFTPNEYIFLTGILKGLGYAVKPPFGKGHWASSMDYFSLGLAIEPKFE